jgi:hypothetical protein
MLQNGDCKKDEEIKYYKIQTVCFCSEHATWKEFTAQSEENERFAFKN